MKIMASHGRYQIKEIAGGGLLSVPGLEGAGLSCGIKDSGAPDLALISASQPMTARGVFTRNRLAAAPVNFCRHALNEQPLAQSIVINSGNANAMTGERGEKDAAKMASQVEQQRPGPTLVLSTGIIGVPLPMEKILPGIDLALGQLRPDTDPQVAQAMLTTDSCTKMCAVKVSIDSETFTVGGVAKGSGMIHPDMATMLAIMATDAPVTAAALDQILRYAVDRSFHEITVDGDTSTNDSVLLLAGGADASPLDLGDPRLEALRAAVTLVADDLANKIVADGEGASRVMEFWVVGASTKEQARAVARTVTKSLLVKTALAGGDPNWGRILAAAANAGHDLKAENLALSIAGMPVFKAGPLPVDRQALDQAFSQSRVVVELNLGQGSQQARALTSDITKHYVVINSEYST